MKVIYKIFATCSLTSTLLASSAAPTVSPAAEYKHLYSSLNFLENLPEGAMISPSSIASALYLAASSSPKGSRTHKQILDSFGFENNESLKDFFNLSKESEFVKTTIALYIPKTSSFVPKADFVTTMESADRFLINEKEPHEVDSYFSEFTEGRIPNILEGIEPDTELSLLNVLYAKFTWERPFKNNNTTDAVFTTRDGRSQEVSMMFEEFHEGTTPIVLDADDEVRSFALPYKGLRYFALYHKISRITPIDSLGDELNLLIRSIENNSTNSLPLKVKIPKMNFSVRYNLNGALQSAGMTDAFTTIADFSVLSTKRILISKVLHIVNGTVDEDGSIVAAATRMDAKSAGIDRRKKYTAYMNEPHVFAIYDRITKSFIVLGKIIDTRYMLLKDLKE